MTYPSYEEYQYNSCVSRGICSISPQISALQTVIVLYLRIFAKYTLNLDVDNNIKTFILNTISVTLFNPEFNEESFLFAIENFKEVLPEIIEKNSMLEYQNSLQTEREKFDELLTETSSINQAIKYGEKIFKRSKEELDSEIENLFTLLLMIVKTLSINLLELESYNESFSLAYNEILHLLSYLNINDNFIDVLEAEMREASKISFQLSEKLFQIMEKSYGTQIVAEVSFTTVPGKAVLVTGSSLKELENILAALKDEAIDVYTHDDMMLAHTFPKFKENKKLKGQFGFGLENCLIDFATFPGPIILTKNSLHNIENFYRGRLFTTDYLTLPKGIIKIKDNDFTGVIESAYESKGFKRGKICESVEIGYDFEEVKALIRKKIETQEYKKIFIISQDDYSLEQKTYFEKLIKHTPKNVLIISFSYKNDSENLIHLNTCFDYFSLIKNFEYLRDYNLPITIFIPKCNRDSISQMIYLSSFNDVRILLGKCAPIILNPALLKTLSDSFGISVITAVKKDLEKILG